MSLPARTSGRNLRLRITSSQPFAQWWVKPLHFESTSEYRKKGIRQLLRRESNWRMFLKHGNGAGQTVNSKQQHMLSANIGAPSPEESQMIGFDISDKILKFLMDNGYAGPSLKGLNVCGVVLREINEIRQLGVKEGIALSKCDDVCRALFGLE